MWADVIAAPSKPTDLSDTASFVRDKYPHGPAPEGWHTVKHCAHNIPHNWDDEERNAQLNEDHYEALADYEYVR